MATKKTPAKKATTRKKAPAKKKAAPKKAPLPFDVGDQVQVVVPGGGPVSNYQLAGNTFQRTVGMTGKVVEASETSVVVEIGGDYRERHPYVPAELRKL